MNMMLYAKEFQMILSCNHLSDSTFYLTLNLYFKNLRSNARVSPSIVKAKRSRVEENGRDNYLKYIMQISKQMGVRILPTSLLTMDFGQATGAQEQNNASSGASYMWKFPGII
jgi:hypothetical protein